MTDRPVTDFETAVRAALWDTGIVDQETAGRLAPQVAAAMEAGAAQITATIGLAVGPVTLADALAAKPPARSWQDAGLAALRGTPDP